MVYQPLNQQQGLNSSSFTGFQNPVYQDVFEGDPLGRQGIFNAGLPQNLGGNQLSFLQSLFEPTFNRYLGQLVQNPALRFTDFVTQNFNPQRELLRAPGQVSGSGFGGTTLFNLR